MSLWNDVGTMGEGFWGVLTGQTTANDIVNSPGYNQWVNEGASINQYGGVANTQGYGPYMPNTSAWNGSRNGNFGLSPANDSIFQYILLGIVGIILFKFVMD